VPSSESTKDRKRKCSQTSRITALSFLSSRGRDSAEERKRERGWRGHQPDISTNGARKKGRRRDADASRGCPAVPVSIFFSLAPLCGNSMWREFGRPPTRSRSWLRSREGRDEHFRMSHSGGWLLGGIEAGISIPRAVVRTPVRKTDPGDDDRGGNVGHKSDRANLLFLSSYFATTLPVRARRHHTRGVYQEAVRLDEAIKDRESYPSPFAIGRRYFNLNRPAKTRGIERISHELSRHSSRMLVNTAIDRYNYRSRASAARSKTAKNRCSRDDVRSIRAVLRRHGSLPEEKSRIAPREQRGDK